MPFLYYYLFILFIHPYLAMWWKIFPKADRPYWEALIPGYNYFILFKFTLKKGFWSLLFIFPGVHLIMMMVANVTLIRRFGFYSLWETTQGIIFPYYIFFKINKENIVYGKETNWANTKEVEDRKWGDHLVLFLAIPVIGHIITTILDAISRDRPGQKTRVKEWGDSILFALIAAGLIRTYVFEPFQIPTGSMEKTLLVGDFLFVNKLAYGPKVPVTPLSHPLVHNTVPWINIRSYTTIEKGSYVRLPGFGNVERNEVVVFNYPSGDTAVYDPRMPNGLMGHDYYGILNDEALFQFRIKNNLLKENLSKEDSTKFNLFIKNYEDWKAVARKNLEDGQFPVYMPENNEGQTHGGLIYRPVDKRENYIKRCVGIPGDKIKVVNSVLYVNGKPAKVTENQCLQYLVNFDSKISSFPSAAEMERLYGLENDPSGVRRDFEIPCRQNCTMGHNHHVGKYLLTITESEKENIKKDFPSAKFEINIPIVSKHVAASSAIDLVQNLSTFPKDFYINNTPYNFAEIQIPSKGQTIKINKQNIAWYRRIITAYEGHKLEELKDGTIKIDNKNVSTYTFDMDYYWMMGDNRYNSADSRIWGFVPEDHIVGRASLVWFSKSPYKGIRWDRILKFIE